MIEAVNAYDSTESCVPPTSGSVGVSLNGPDGALYVVDFYRGIIEGYNFITTFLRDQILERRLTSPCGATVLYRIVHENGMGVGAGDVQSNHRRSRGSDALRVVARRCPAGLVGRGDRSHPRFANMAFNDPRAQPRLHALWTLEGLGLRTKS